MLLNHWFNGGTQAQVDRPENARADPRVPVGTRATLVRDTVNEFGFTDATQLI